MTKIFIKLVIVLSIFIGLLLPIYLPFVVLSISKKESVTMPNPVVAADRAAGEIVYRIQKREVIGVAGKTMEPLYSQGDIICLDASLSNFQKGDVLIYKPLSDETLFIKRLYGLPGEKIIFENQERKLNSNEYFVKSENSQEAKIKTEVINKDQIRGAIIFQIKSPQDEVKCLAKVG